MLIPSTHQPTIQDPAGSTRTRRDPLPLITVASILLAVFALGGCKDRQATGPKQTRPQSSRCPKASVAWSLSTTKAPYKRAGLSTNPPGQEEALMGKVPTLVQKWAKTCQTKGQWSCSSAAVVGFLQKDAQGTLTSVQAITPCPAARCLARQAARSRVRKARPGTDICIYVELERP